MAAGSVVGRVTGLLRTIAIGAAIGGALLGNDYALANNLPNMVYELLLGGVLSAAVVPMLVRARVDSDDGGQAYAQRLLTAATVGLAVATALAIGRGAAADPGDRHRRGRRPTGSWSPMLGLPAAAGDLLLRRWPRCAVPC